jgi:DNA-binding CsgD family transcriptional regulator
MLAALVLGRIWSPACPKNLGQEDKAMVGMSFSETAEEYSFVTLFVIIGIAAFRDSIGSGVSHVNSSNSSGAGLILLNWSLRLLYCNSEALRILTYPNPLLESPDSQFLESIRSIVAKRPGTNGSPVTTHFMSGRRRYLCRSFVLEAESTGGSKAAIAIILERQHPVFIDFARRFQLTNREIEVVHHLADGLTNKEIAHQMNISPVTVKTLLRLTMLRVGVTTRAGLLGKLIALLDTNGNDLMRMRGIADD